MSEQEKMAGIEINNPDSFAEKLKNADKKEGSSKAQRSQMEEVIKRNKEQVQRSENALEKAQEKLATAPSPVKTQVKDDKKEEDEEKQKEHVKFQAKDIASIENPDDQITKIVDLASKKDPYFAIKVAKHIDNNYILDRVHDELTEDQVRDALIKKGLLEEIQ